MMASILFRILDVRYLHSVVKIKVTTIWNDIKTFMFSVRY